MERIEFTVPAVPVAQPRQRHRVVHSGGKAFATNYTPAKDPVNAFKAACQLAASQAYQGPPLDGPLHVLFVFVMPRVKPSWLKKGSPWFWPWKEGRRIPHASNRNDRDNLMKSLQDALNGLVWKDDGLICAGPVEKWLAADDEQPHVFIAIESLTAPFPGFIDFPMPNHLTAAEPQAK